MPEKLAHFACIPYCEKKQCRAPMLFQSKTTQFISPSEARYDAQYAELKIKFEPNHFRLKVLEYLFQQKFPLPSSLHEVSISILSELIYFIRLHQNYISRLAQTDHDGTHKNDISSGSIAKRHEDEAVIEMIVQHFSSEENMLNPARIKAVLEKIKQTTNTPLSLRPAC